jgi:hypothetical protein
MLSEGMGIITKPTVFILGAGASKHLYYPTGPELTYKIISGIETQGGLYKAMFDFFHDSRGIVLFAKDFKHSGRYSIDDFLEFRPEYEELGKFAIAHEIALEEATSRLFNDKENWYKWFSNTYFRKFEDVSENKVSFITFNYDRSLEQYFYESLKAAFNKSDEEIRSALKNIKIIHIHGKLGSLPWENRRGEVSRSYKGENTNDDIFECSELIRVIHEHRKSTNEQIEAIEILTLAENIYFLGFGYGESNLGALDFSRMRPEGLVNGTSLGMTKNERTDIHNILMKKTKSSRVYLKNLTCYDLCRIEPVPVEAPVLVEAE